MSRQRLWSIGGLAAALTIVWLAAVSLSGQTPPAATLRTAWGDPDLQGTWFVTFDVPLERSAANAGKEFLTDQEIAEADARKGASPGRNARSDDTTQDVSGAYNAVFNSILRTGRRTSMIIDPADGRIPVLSNAKGGGRGGFGRGGPGGGAATQNDNPETVAQSPRCLGVPMPFLPLNTAFAQGTVMQIVQSPNSLAIYMEDDHAGGGNRMVYLDGRPHLPANIRTYLGDSRGHWEGDTLVVETTNFALGFRGSNPDTYKMTERFRRVGPNDLQRRITFEDPQTWSQPWTVLIEMGKTGDERHMIFDSACHEGNYGMTGILAGARADERAGKQ
jgi:hypothetical protein